MFHIFRRKNRDNLIDLSGIAIDMHSHLLPGIDDGAADASTSIALLNGLIQTGLKGFITTPHILWDLYRNDDVSIGNALDTLTETAKIQGLNFSISAAAEYMMDDHFTSLVNNKSDLRRIADNYVLVEFSFVGLPYNWKELFFNLQLQGYQPILAHPERYGFLSATPQIFQEIVAMGVLLQVNLNSLTGYYGKSAYQLAQYLSKHKLVSFLGTDLHHQRHIDALLNSNTLMPEINTILASGKILNSKLSE
ncbi:tyrosine-protein phosphatase [Flavihumibacter solisilvae]|uniref:protein-tyrosine-phosphatase n=1 Tax=Flavihumibacter solisilvae TaxID=1349421 RepID=A0A0C1L520_9BACT|nr:CpsB/CapC family capsule biosynthesis tyrosine phosphatase [Flavihumibacter solisilvae]KIC94651.1 hypothetical protein OI18_11230 [Flavihumibacter solisilvae]